MKPATSAAEEPILSAQKKDTTDFAAQADARRTTLLHEIWHFLAHNRKWWLLPIIVVLIVLGAFVLIGGSGVAPFIYALF